MCHLVEFEWMRQSVKNELLTVIVSYASLYSFLASDGSLVRIGYDVHERDTIKSNHFFEIHITPSVTVGEI
jgi:hypothetical protein